MKESHSNFRGSVFAILGAVLVAILTTFPPTSIELGAIYILFVVSAILHVLPSVPISSTLSISGLLLTGYGVLILVSGAVGALIPSVVILAGVITTIAPQLYYDA